MTHGYSSTLKGLPVAAHPAAAGLATGITHPRLTNIENQSNIRID
jgi:hypothetical protein